jgi:hypothetical protein
MTSGFLPRAWPRFCFLARLGFQKPGQHISPRKAVRCSNDQMCDLVF